MLTYNHLVSRLPPASAFVPRRAALVRALAASGGLMLACAPTVQEPPFVDVSAEVGLDFVHINGMTGERYFNEIVGSGAALVDYDNDGDLDLYLVQGGPLDPAAADGPKPTDALWRNDTPDGGTGLRLVETTAASGIDSREYGMGVVVGDVNGDGHPDLYITNFGPNRLWVNRGDGTFLDGTTPTLSEPRWSTGATFIDYDLDDDLDLFVANYVEYRVAQHRPCLNAAGAIEYCGPASFPGETDRLWRNLGDGSFEDVTGRAGIIDLAGSGLGAVTADFDADGWPDIYVANDLMPNYLWINQGDGTFREDALLAGCAVNESGAPEASMGLAVADFDRDGDEDLFMTHLDAETNTAFLNRGDGLFEDASNEWGLSTPSLGLTGFGTAAIDYDNDGWIDLVTANGAVRTLADQRLAGDPLPLREPNLLLRNVGGSFRAETGQAPALEVLDVSRGLASGDIDNDGDDDLLEMNNGGAARLLRNEIGQDGAWLGVSLVGPGASGARVSIDADGRSQIRTVRPNASYCSSSDSRLRLGDVGGDVAVDIALPNGRRRRLVGPTTQRYLVVPH